MYADDTGFNDWSLFGAVATRTPEIERMAREGAVFTSFYTAESLCSPSRAGIMTGRFPVRNGVVPTEGGDARVFGVTDTGGLPRNETSMATMLRSYGYSTGMVGKWHLGINKEPNDGYYLPHNHGFDSVAHTLPFSNHWKCDESGKFEKEPDPELCFLYDGTGTVPVQQPINHTWLTKTLAMEAVDFINNATSTPTSRKPYFLYYAFAHNHVSLFSSPDFPAEASPRGLYGAENMELDWAVGQVMETIRSTDNNTFVVLTSDHGAHIELCLSGGSNAPFRGGKANSVWEGGTRVPAVMWWGGGAPLPQTALSITPSTRYFQHTSTMDLFPTALELASNSTTFKVPLDGRSLLPLFPDRIHEASPHHGKGLPYYCASRLVAFRLGSYKAHYFTQPLPPDNFSQTDCPEGGTSTGEKFYAWDCFATNVVPLDPPILFHVERDPAEVFPIPAGSSEYKAVFPSLNAAKVSYESEIEFGPPQIGPNSAKNQPCCNPPSCCCDYGTCSDRNKVLELE